MKRGCSKEGGHNTASVDRNHYRSDKMSFKSRQAMESGEFKYQYIYISGVSN